MKKILYLLFVLISIQINAQKINVNEVPEDVIIAFDQRFPDAFEHFWFKANDIYLVKFLNKIEIVKAVFNENGEWVRTFTYVKKTEIPDAAITYFENNYRSKGYILSKYGFAQLATGRANYQLELTTHAQKGKITELHFGMDGNFLGSEIVDEIDLSIEETIIKGVKLYKEINISEIPQKIISDIKAQYQNYQIKQSLSIVNGTYQGGYYIVIRKPGKAKSIELFYDKFSSLSDKIEPEEALDSNQLSAKKEKEFNPQNYNNSLPVKAKELPSPIIEYIKLNYSEYEINNSVQLFQTNLPEVYHIKIKKRGDKALIELFFDMYGDLIKKVEPVDKIEEDGAFDNWWGTGGIDNNDGSNGDMINTEKEISAKELPSQASIFLRNNYRDHYIQKVLFINNNKMKQTYFVEVKKQAEDPVKLYFDFTGNLISNDDPIWKEKQQEAKAKNAASTKLSKFDIPQAVLTTFSKKNPRATETEWEKEGENYMARFIYNKLNIKTAFSEDGKWVYTATPYGTDRLSNVIKNYISKNYSGYKIEKALQLQRADKKNYYSVVLSRKIKGGREYMGLKFNNSGKFLDVDDNVNTETGEQ